jgi:hypothetical protein
MSFQVGDRVVAVQTPFEFLESGDEGVVARIIDKDLYGYLREDTIYQVDFDNHELPFTSSVGVSGPDSGWNMYGHEIAHAVLRGEHVD